MELLRCFYGECRQPERNVDKFYLLTLGRQDGRYAVDGHFGRRTNTASGQQTHKYAGISQVDALRAFDLAMADRQKHGYVEQPVPDCLREELTRRGGTPSGFEPLLAHANFRPIAGTRLLPAGAALVALGALAWTDGRDEAVVRIDTNGNLSQASGDGLRRVGIRLPCSSADLADLVDQGLAPLTVVLGRQPGRTSVPVVIDVLELSGQRTGDLPGAERIMLAADLSVRLGIALDRSPQRPPDWLPAGTYLMALDQPHRPADGSPSRFVVTADWRSR